MTAFSFQNDLENGTGKDTRKHTIAPQNGAQRVTEASEHDGLAGFRDELIAALLDARAGKRLATPIYPEHEQVSRAYEFLSDEERTAEQARARAGYQRRKEQQA